MNIENYSVLCDACSGRGYTDYILCDKCEGNGSIVVPDERRTLAAAMDSYVKWARGFRAALKGIGLK
jgi:hypothetical protein